MMRTMYAVLVVLCAVVMLWAVASILSGCQVGQRVAAIRSVELLGDSANCRALFTDADSNRIAVPLPEDWCRRLFGQQAPGVPGPVESRDK